MVLTLLPSSQLIKFEGYAREDSIFSKNLHWRSISFWLFSKVGGLDSRDQSRSRSRMSFVSRLTFENRRECPSCWDQLFFSRSRFLKPRFFNRDLSLSRYLSRWSRYIETIETIKIVETFQNLLRFLDIFERFLLIDNCRRSHRCLLVKWIKSSNLDGDLWKL
jgi:hypothetical protein